MTLGDDLRREAQATAYEAFGPNATPEQIKRVYECEMDLFAYHAGTGDDAECRCGAHGRFRPGPVIEYRDEDFG